MKLFERKSKIERLLETIENQQMLKAALRNHNNLNVIKRFDNIII